MVTRLPQPEACSIALLDQVLVERNRGRNARFFRGIATEWRRRVESYLNERGNPETVSDWPAIMENTTPFLTLYRSPADNSSQAPVLTTLRERQMQFCPACGEEGTPNTLDHHLPIERFPHFAVTPANLSPMCDICQTAKGERTVDAQGRRIFLHPYFDEFLDAQILRLTIGRPLAAPMEFVLEPDPNLPDELVGLVRRHIGGLQLERRYGAFFRDEYIRLLRLAQAARDAGIDIRANVAAFKHLHQIRALNLWPHIFYSSVMEDAELLEFLANGELPTMR